MKVVVGLGNPGVEYDPTRHNVGWWVLDRVSADWGLGPFEREGALLVAGGAWGGEDVCLVKPNSFMNRSGPALVPLLHREGLDWSEDLLVVVDDAALEVGRIRLRPSGSPGGHNGLRSVEQTLGSGEFARLRIGVGSPPPGQGLKDWVLSPMDEEDEEVVVGLLPELSQAVGVWLTEGVGAAMNRYNR